MGTEKITGIVLKEKEHGESSKQIFVLAKQVGKICLFAKGARKPKSKLLAATQPFCYSDFLVFQGRGFHSITQGESIETFYEMRTDMDRFLYGSYLLELVERTSQEGMEQDDVLELLLRTLWQIAKRKDNPRLCSVIFGLKFLQYSGWMPDMECCAVCGAKVSEVSYFSALAGGAVCTTHSESGSPISKGAIKAMEYVFHNSGQAIYRFRLSQEVLEELEQLVDASLQIHMNVKLKSKEFLDEPFF
ncbi:MAG: DNA repair protein RecO [Epulopiscium sp.]|jgi:DNA repair protein RecO (recombination protein O)|nr:DNA repair protein RecO [Candidatus Epulonipiscium sp.]